jgi:hypothetical protein
MKKPIAAALAALLAMSAAAQPAAEEGAKPVKEAQASIPFANIGRTIRDWQADGMDGLWVRDARRQWYYARLLGPCIGLDFAHSIGFRTGASSSFDRFSSIIVPGHDRCHVQSFTKSEGPPGEAAAKPVEPTVESPQA